EKEQPEHQSNHDFVCSAPSNSARESTAARGDVARGMGSGQVYHSDPAAERGDSRARPPISHLGHRFGLYFPETWQPRAKLPSSPFPSRERSVRDALPEWKGRTRDSIAHTATGRGHRYRRHHLARDERPGYL